MDGHFITQKIYSFKNTKTMKLTTMDMFPT